MEKRVLKILAVDDPAVRGYLELGIIQAYTETTGQAIEFNSVSWAEYGDMYQQIIEDNQEYDIFMVAGHLWLSELLEKELIMPLELPKAELLEKVLDEVTYNGEQYLSPSFCDGHLFVYRKSYFEKWQMELPSKHITIAEIMAWAQGFNQAETINPIAMKAASSELFLDILPYFRATGIEPVTTQGEAITDYQLLTEGINWYKELLTLTDEQYRYLDNEGIKESIQQNRAIMTTTWNGQMGAIFNEDCLNKDELGFATIEGSWNVTWGFCIHKKSGNQVASQKFLTYLLSRDVATQIGEYSGAPVLKPLLTDEPSHYPWFDSHYQLVSTVARELPKSALLSQSMATLVSYIEGQLSEG